MARALLEYSGDMYDGARPCDFVVLIFGRNFPVTFW